MANRTLVVSVLADTKKFSDGIKSTAKVAAAAVAAVGVAVGGFVALSVKAAGEAEKVYAQTAAAIESTGAAAGKTSADIRGLAGSLSFMSGVDDEVIQSGANILLTFTKIQGVNFDAATTAALDMSVALGTDLQSASIQVGKALNDPILGVTSLSRAGVQFTEVQRAQIDAMVAAGDVAGAQAIILGELETQFGGSAAAFGNTFEGAIGKVKSLFGDVQQAIGFALLPSLTTAINRVADFLLTLTSSAAFSGFIDNLANLTEALANGEITFGTITEGLQAGVQSAADWLTSGGIDTIVDGLISGREAFFAAALEVFPAIVDALVTVVPEIVTGVVALLTSLVAVLVESAPTLLAGAVALFLGLVQGLASILPTIIASVVSLVPVIVTALVAMVPDLIEGAIALFTALVDAVVQVVPPLILQIIDILPGIIEALIGLIPLLIEGAISLFMALVEAIPLIIPPLIEGIIGLIPILIDTLVTLIPALIGGAVSLFIALVEAIPIILPLLITAVISLIPQIIGALIGAIPKLLSGAVTLFMAIVDGAAQIIPKLLEAGGDVIQGFRDGVTDAWNGFIKWWNDTVGDVVDVVKDIFGIRSPSRVFDDIGVNLIKGLERGLGRSNKVTALMGDLSSQVVDGFTPQLEVPVIGGAGSRLPDGAQSASAVQLEKLADAILLKASEASSGVMRFAREDLDYLADVIARRTRVSDRMGIV